MPDEEPIASADIYAILGGPVIGRGRERPTESFRNAVVQTFATD